MSRKKGLASRLLTSWFEVETLNRFLQRFVVGFEKQAFAPDDACFLAFAHHPKHLAQVCCNFSVGSRLVGGLQNFQGFLVLACTGIFFSAQ